MLGPLEMVAIFFVFGCPTWLLSKLIDRAFASKQKRSLGGDTDVQERARALEVQLLGARRENDQLQKQLDWHTKMLAVQGNPRERGSDTIAVASAVPA